jgi:RHS repeat-associated protein
LITAVSTNNTNPPTSTNTIASWNYNYDNDYRQTRQTFTGMKNTGVAMPADSFYYGYDTAGRLNAIGRDGLATLYATWDHDGNRTAYNDPSGTTFYETFNADDSIAARQDTALHYPKYLAWGGLEADGAVAGDRAYVYDGFDRTKCVGGLTLPTSCAGADATYTYDGLDRQTSHADTTNGTTALHYDGLANTIAVEEKMATPKDIAIALDAADMPIGSTDFSAGTTPQYLGDDGHGNVTTVTGPTTINCTARFDPFGTPVTNTGAGTGGATCFTGATSNDFFYRSGRRDGAVGDYQFGARTYDPKKASFTVPDSYRAADPAKDLSVGTDPLTANRYNYVNGDPVNLVDPDGHVSRRFCEVNDVSPGECDVINLIGGGATALERRNASRNLVRRTYESLLAVRAIAAYADEDQHLERMAEFLEKHEWQVVGGVTVLGVLGVLATACLITTDGMCAQIGVTAGAIGGPSAAEMWSKEAADVTDVVSETVTSADPRKFAEFAFTTDKAPVFRSLGYAPEDADTLAREFERQAAENLLSGDFTLGDLDKYGQRINIEIELRGVGASADKVSYLKSGWMIRPDGTVTLNTPMSGFTRPQG